MKPKDLINKVARKADTKPKGSHITVTDVSRVHKLIFDELASLPSEELLAYVSKAVTASKKARAKARAKK
jgi:hypothetical protein